MTEKNRNLLRQFNNSHQIDKLLSFASQERKRGDILSNKYRQAKYYERALVADLLIFGMLRMQNITTLRIDVNLRTRADHYILDFAGAEMKNGRPHAVALPATISDKIDEFIRIYRPRLAGSVGPYLFPGEQEGKRHHSAIRREFQSAIWKHCGLRVHPHLMRHLMAKILLDKDPNQIFKISRQLGHADVATTQLYYLESDALAASTELTAQILQRAQSAQTKRAGK